MKSLTLQSPSKINLYLKVTGKRKDGYHRIYTLFHRISLCDTMRLTRRAEGFSLTCSEARIPVGESNVITKAYRLLQREVPGLGGVHVRLTKKIPVGAGLGGGSGNAATFLLGMKKIYSIPLSNKDLVSMGKRLGADVPFFLHGITEGVGSDRGDRIRALPKGPRHHFLLVLSRKGLSTRRVYQGLKIRAFPASLTKLSRAVKMLCDFLTAKNYHQAATLLHNDLELPAFCLRPSLVKISQALRKSGVFCTLMSGSGATIFGMISGPQEAKRIQTNLKRKFPSSEFVLCHSF